MKLGIIGLTNVGKTTLFNAITKSDIATNKSLFSTINPNIGIVAVPDERLNRLTEIFKPKKTIPAYIEFVDIAGLVKGSGRGEGMGNKFLVQLREVDALIHVIRFFEDADVAHVESSLDPIRDMETINLELIVADLESVEKRLESIEKSSRTIDQKTKAEAEILQKIKLSLEKEIPARNIDLSSEEIKIIKSLGLLTFKPVIYLANLSENNIGKDISETQSLLDLKQFSEKDNSEMVTVSAKIENELSQLNSEDREMFMSELGINQSGLEQLIRISYRLLGLISFLTAGTDEVRAWTIKKGTNAPAAAGKVHSDIERGFIRAETIPYDAFIEAGSFVKAKEKGLMRSEGKAYIVNDGDIIDFRFNV
jgi:GTP-binding protein YchF